MILGLQNLPIFKATSVCIGVFDGVHVGHRRIIRSTVRRGRALGRPSVGLTFYPHPSHVLAPGKELPLFYSLRHRIVHMENLGLDHVCVVRFTRAFSRITAEAFVRDVLVNKLRAKFVCVGSDFRFGRGAAGDVRRLSHWALQYGFRLHIVNPVKLDSRAVSSTRIRAMILKGRLKEAARLLGRPVSLYGSVIRGKGRGRRLGFPTVNLRLHHETLPPPGVYAVRALCKNRLYQGALHLGPRPTFNERAVHIEAYLFNVHKSFYGKEMELFLIEKIRDIMRFSSEQALKAQISKDVEKVSQLCLYKSPINLYNH